MSEIGGVDRYNDVTKWTVKTINDVRDILLVRTFVQSVAKATRWKDSVPDPAEHVCGVMVRIDSQAHVFLQFAGPVQFPISVSLGAVAVNGKAVDPKTDRHQAIIAAAEIFGSQIKASTDVAEPNANLALINRFTVAWKALDATGEPKSAFEIYRMFATNSESNDLLRQVRVQFAPYIQGETNRFQQMDDYLSSRPDRFRSELSPIAGNKVWSIK